MSEKKKIEFDEIQEGDLIEVVDTYASGLKLKREGIAADLATGPANSAWYHKGTHRQQVLVHDYEMSRTEVFLLKREEKKDHLVVSTRVVSGTVEAQTLVGRTKTDAEELAEQWNAKERSQVGDRRIFRAVKVA